MVAALSNCDEPSPAEVVPVSLTEGTYRVVGGQGYTQEEQARLFAMTAQLDRANARIVFTMEDGSQKPATLLPRPPERWEPGCWTMGGHSLNEVADLSPAPLQLESLTFVTPLVHAYCSPARMVLADAYGDAQGPWLAFDLQ